MAKFVWIAYDKHALAVLVEAEDLEEAREKVVADVVACDKGDLPEAQVREEFLREEETNWRVYPVSEESL